MKQLLMIAVTSIVLSGCQLTRVEGKINDTQVKVNTTETNDQGKFCPPGQAKKGKC
ncbi:MULTISPECIES: hypothetical protein [Vibrio]|uniref:hypothetical protein n=1 Tax=Vibrio TaxID=662 RepID=UPI00074080EE|nr:MULTISPECIES: hypothetical protein [Vibrio]KUI97754.1 hypothetical protein VRK_33170 [Vibrio sp. MEBiC08052]WNJ97182.1 hypothetical protein RND59_18430 [Vibrio ruber]